MKTIFLDNETLSILSDIREGKIENEEDNKAKYQKLEEALLNQKRDDENAKDIFESDAMGEVMIETYLKSPVRVSIEFCKPGAICIRGYYFVDDVIVMLNMYRDGGEFMWLPTAKLLMGSIADMIGDENIVSVSKEIDASEAKNDQYGNEEYEETLTEECDKENYTDVIKENVKDEYKKFLQGSGEQSVYLKMTGTGISEEKNCFIYIAFDNKTVYYFKNKGKKLNYGKANFHTIVNIIGEWMLNQHRSLIVEMQKENNTVNLS